MEEAESAHSLPGLKFKEMMGYTIGTPMYGHALNNLNRSEEAVEMGRKAQEEMWDMRSVAPLPVFNFFRSCGEWVKDVSLSTEDDVMQQGCLREALGYWHRAAEIADSYPAVSPMVGEGPLGDLGHCP